MNESKEYIKRELSQKEYKLEKLEREADSLKDDLNRAEKKFDEKEYEIKQLEREIEIDKSKLMDTERIERMEKEQEGMKKSGGRTHSL